VIDITIMQRLMAIRMPHASRQEVIALIGDVVAQQVAEENRRYERERKRTYRRDNLSPGMSQVCPGTIEGQDGDNDGTSPGQKEIPSALPLEKTRLLSNLSLKASSEKSKEVEEVVVVGTERARDRKPRAVGAPLPDDWQPKQLHHSLAVSLGVSVERMIGMAAAMRCWAKAEAGRAVTKKSDWDQAFSGWMRRDVARSNGGYQNGRSSLTGSAGDAARRIGAAFAGAVDYGTYQPDHGLLPPGRVRES
jgi:hypothetical protein